MSKYEKLIEAISDAVNDMDECAADKADAIVAAFAEDDREMNLSEFVSWFEEIY